jgi:DNA-directed RNA polymerase subunit RPC12/RpoP
MSPHLRHNDSVQHLIDDPPVIDCPHCGSKAAAVPISVPKFELVGRFELTEVGIVARCSGCNRAVFLRYRVQQISNPIVLYDAFEIINRGVEPFEVQYLSGAVLDDFNEALVC